MADLSMDPEPLTWLRQQLEQAHPDLLREMIAAITQQLMAAEAQEACGADHGERSAERVNSRNGYRAAMERKSRLLRSQSRWSEADAWAERARIEHVGLEVDEPRIGGAGAKRTRRQNTDD